MWFRLGMCLCYSVVGQQTICVSPVYSALILVRSPSQALYQCEYLLNILSNSNAKNSITGNALNYPAPACSELN